MKKLMELNPTNIYALTSNDWWENISVYCQGSYTLVDYNRDILFKRIKKKLIRVLKIDELEILEEVNLFTELYIEGKDITFLVGVLECEYDLRSNNKLACQINTVGDLLNYCEQTWPQRNIDLWFPDPLLPEPEPKTRLRRILKSINKVGPINRVTTFVRTLFKRSPNPLRKYIIQGRRRWIKIAHDDIQSSEEVLEKELVNWELWTQEDWIDWYGAKWLVYQKQYNEKIENENYN